MMGRPGGLQCNAEKLAAPGMAGLRRPHDAPRAPPPLRSVLSAHLAHAAAEEAAHQKVHPACRQTPALHAFGRATAVLPGQQAGMGAAAAAAAVHACPPPIQHVRTAPQQQPPAAPPLTQRLDVALVAVPPDVVHRHHVLAACRGVVGMAARRVRCWLQAGAAAPAQLHKQRCTNAGPTQHQHSAAQHSAAWHSAAHPGWRHTPPAPSASGGGPSSSIPLECCGKGVRRKVAWLAASHSVSERRSAVQLARCPGEGGKGYGGEGGDGAWQALAHRPMQGPRHLSGFHLKLSQLQGNGQMTAVRSAGAAAGRTASLQLGRGGGSASPRDVHAVLHWILLEEPARPLGDEEGRGQDGGAGKQGEPGRLRGLGGRRAGTPLRERRPRPACLPALRSLSGPTHATPLMPPPPRRPAAAAGSRRRPPTHPPHLAEAVCPCAIPHHGRVQAEHCFQRLGSRVAVIWLAAGTRGEVVCGRRVEERGGERRSSAGVAQAASGSEWQRRRRRQPKAPCLCTALPSPCCFPRAHPSGVAGSATSAPHLRPRVCARRPSSGPWRFAGLAHPVTQRAAAAHADAPRAGTKLPAAPLPRLPSPFPFPRVAAWCLQAGHPCARQRGAGAKRQESLYHP